MDGRSFSLVVIAIVGIVGKLMWRLSLTHSFVICCLSHSLQLTPWCDVQNVESQPAPRAALQLLAMRFETTGAPSAPDGARLGFKFIHGYGDGGLAS